MNTTDIQTAPLCDDAIRIIEARHHDPYCYLGRHDSGKDTTIRVFIRDATNVLIVDNGKPMRRLGDSDLFEWTGPKKGLPQQYQLQWTNGNGDSQKAYDPYSFPPQLTDFDIHLYGEGKHLAAYQFLGAHPRTINGISGVLFAVWAPNAERVSVVYSGNQWDGRCNPMRSRGCSGIWETFLPGVTVSTRGTSGTSRTGGALRAVGTV